MGIPLYNVPDIRRFYGMDPAVCSKIDFFAVDYPPITSHCCASRITAENPDEGFKPTSGKINSVRFQSAGDCWGSPAAFFFAKSPVPSLRVQGEGFTT
ncbi:HFA1 [Symbiodinium sp. KB8]|nr:HFA1 [Symbiodinium sp. KB8]